MEENQRYKQRINAVVDMQFMAWMMDSLDSKTNIRHGSWITAKKIKEVTSEMQNNNNQTLRRINLLDKADFLRSKPMSKKKRMERYGTLRGGRYRIYTMGSAGKEYLKINGAFIRQDGKLMSKGNKEIIKRKETYESQEEIKKPKEEYIGVLE